MRIRWDEDKRQSVLKKRSIDFADLEDLLYLPFVEDQRSDDPEQYRIIGFAKGRMATYIIEYREDELDEFIWVVTAWKSTNEEKKAYEKETQQD